MEILFWLGGNISSKIHHVYAASEILQDNMGSIPSGYAKLCEQWERFE
jgi:hypothetical protein